MGFTVIPPQRLNRNILVVWIPSADPNAAFTRIYRSQTSGGPYVLLGQVAQITTSFLDAQVIPGSTYFYVTTEIDNTGAESTFSVETSATADGPP